MDVSDRFPRFPRPVLETPMSVGWENAIAGVGCGSDRALRCCNLICKLLLLYFLNLQSAVSTLAGDVEGKRACLDWKSTETNHHWFWMIQLQECCRKWHMTTLRVFRLIGVLLSVAIAVSLSIAPVEAWASSNVPTYRRQAAGMNILSINLQDGFADEPVTIRVNNREVFRKESVKTRLLLGYADSFEVQVPAGSVNVEVLLPSRNLSETISLMPQSQPVPAAHTRH